MSGPSHDDKPDTSRKSAGQHRSPSQADETANSEETELVLAFVPASRLYDCEHGEPVTYDWCGRGVNG